MHYGTPYLDYFFKKGAMALNLLLLNHDTRTFVGKFRPRLIELTSYKPKLLIRFIMNKLVKTNKHQYHVKIMQQKNK